MHEREKAGFDGGRFEPGMTRLFWGTKVALFFFFCFFFFFFFFFFKKKKEKKKKKER